MNSPLRYAEQICYSSKEVLHFTYEKSKEYADKEGVYVECGVAAGAQVIAMIAGAPNKRIYAIDSFAGIPLPSNRDNQMPGIRMLSKEEQAALPDPGKQVLESTGATSVSEFDFWINISEAFHKQLKYHKAFETTVYEVDGINVVPIVGWFEETLPTLYFEPISFLRLDGDLYNSTYTCLKYLYPKCLPGALIVIDDWALPGCQQAVEDYFFEQQLKMPVFKAVEFNVGSIVIYWTK